MKIRLLSVIIGIVLLSSCNKFLDVQPQVVLTPLQEYQTPTQITAALAGIYTNFKYIYASAYETEYTVATDESYYYNTSFPFTNYSNTSTDNSTNNTAGFWKYCYQSIDNANLLLDNIDASAAIGHVADSSVRHAKGEAYFLRGYYYFLLAQWFGGVPLELHSLGSPTDVYIARTPLSQVYNQIIADMTVADSLLYDQTFANQHYSERVTQEAVEGILARVCLYAAGQPNNDTKRYNDALHWSTKLINAGTHGLVHPYSQVFIDECKKNYNLENIWEIGFDEKGPGKLSSGGGVGVFCGVSQTYNDGTSGAPLYDSGYCYAYVKLHPRLYCSYQSDDYRRNWNCSNYTFSNAVKVLLASSKYWSRSPAKWRREYEPPISRSVQATSGTNFPMLRYADVLLMAAEAENEVNGPNNAYQYINLVRERSIPDSSMQDLAKGLSQSQFRDSIQMERYHELAFEALRLGDLRRWGILVPTIRSLGADINGTNLTYPQIPPILKELAAGSDAYPLAPVNNISAKDMYWPIPQYELSLDPLLTQNPGY